VAGTAVANARKAAVRRGRRFAAGQDRSCPDLDVLGVSLAVPVRACLARCC